MAKKKTTAEGNGAHITLVLDKSGSMNSRRNEVIEGANRFIRETQEADPEARFSLILFDTSVSKVHSGKAITEIEPIDHRVYSPGGGTALLDAVGHAVKDIDDMKAKPSKVVVAIFTDGEENSSHEYRRDDVKASVAQRESESGWQFLFLGANLDSFAEAGAIGMSRSGSSVNWRQSSGGTQAVYAMASSSSSDYLRGTTQTADLSQATYDSLADDFEVKTGENSTSTTTPTIDQKINTRARATTRGTKSK